MDQNYTLNDVLDLGITLYLESDGKGMLILRTENNEFLAAVAAEKNLRDFNDT